MCVKNQLILPKYTDNCDGNGFKVTCALGEIKTSAVALTKKQAKQNCAENMRHLLSKYNLCYTADDEQKNGNNNKPTIGLLEVNKLTFVETYSTVDKATEIAIKSFPQLQKSKGFIVKDHNNISIDSFHSVFKNSFSSETLDRYHLYFNSLNFETINDNNSLKNVFQIISDILGITSQKLLLKVKLKDKYAVAYKLNANSSAYIEIGLGESIPQAERQAFMRIISAINLLLI